MPDNAQTSLLTAAPAPAPDRLIRVAVPRPLHATYDYSVPPTMALPPIGARVRVPFGRQSTVAVCVAHPPSTEAARLRPISETLDAAPLLPPELVALADWMSTYYHHPLGEVLAAILPAAARRGASATPAPPDHWRTTGKRFDKTRAPAQQALVDFLVARGASDRATLTAAGHNARALRVLADEGYIEPCAAPETAALEAPLSPNEAQAGAIEHIRAALSRFQVFLLEGVTGSGKTEVYLQAMAPVVAAGAQVLVLVPEIALTPQTQTRFQRRFSRVTMLHSNLADTARLQAWLAAGAGAVDVVVGTRSAVFTPFERLGLIIVDEEHDGSYKQQDGLRYSARDVAIKRAQSLGVPVVLGSATPALETVHNTAQGRFRHLTLPRRAGGAEMPAYHVVDLRGQSAPDGISVALERAIDRHLGARGQVLVFLNRRGYAPTLLCAACGWQAYCSDCDARLTLHAPTRQSGRGMLICHHCALRFEVPEACEACGSERLLPLGMGTQRSEAALAKRFPDVPVMRIDRDSVRSQRALESRLAQINEGEPCIMVGTQMLAKGHHFPNVTLVAVLNADAGFLSPDFRAPERTAQLIVQVAGRAGRASRPGEVWLQSYRPDNPTLVSLINDGYAGFARRELEERAHLAMPPVSAMAMLRADGVQPASALAALDAMRPVLKATGDQLEVLGPVAAPLARLANRTRYQLMLLAPSRRILHAALTRLTAAGLNVPRDVRWSIDVDPYDSL